MALSDAFHNVTDGTEVCLELLLSLYQDKESNQRKIKASDNYGAPVFKLAHAIQLAANVI
jgi:hypothetical protein